MYEVGDRVKTTFIDQDGNIGVKGTVEEVFDGFLFTTYRVKFDDGEEDIGYIDLELERTDG